MNGNLLAAIILLGALPAQAAEQKGDPAVAEILRQHDKLPLIVAWVIDTSAGFDDRRSTIDARLRRIFRELEGSTAQRPKAVMSVLVGAGSKPRFATNRPTDKTNELLRSWKTIWSDEHGRSDHSTVLRMTALRYRRYQTAQQRAFMLVLVTCQEQTIDPSVAELLTRYRVLLYVMKGKEGFEQIEAKELAPGPLLQSFKDLVGRVRQLDFEVERRDLSKTQREEIGKRLAARGARLDRLPAENKICRALHQRVSFRFKAAELVGTLEYLRELSNVNFYWEVGEKHRINLAVQDKPVAWVLEAMLLPVGLTWDTDGELIYVGNEKQVAAFRQQADRRSARRAKSPGPLAAKLSKRVNCAFHQAILPEVAQYLEEYLGIEVEVPADCRKLLRLSLEQVPVDVLLDLACLQTGLQWRPEGRDRVVLFK